MDGSVICFEPGIAKREGGASRFVTDKSVTLRAEMGDNQPAVCISLEGNGARPSHRGGGWSEDGRMFTLNTIEKHAVCYAIENHPNDSRVKLDASGKTQSLTSRMGTGGGNTPMVLMTIESTNSNARIDETEIAPTVIARGGTGGATIQSCCWAVDSHPMDSRMNLVGGVDVQHSP